ncbi:MULTISPECIES: hypothetical protein [Vibrio]|uniref:Uncharacterized protein n=1 Tax=Vibrio tasmaniensis TaxID=212663 RepID=A0A2N7NND2_9VIBR|nr:hypothetical protein [Vibrio tasmaniensis]PMO89907.1 hypothetical protein BCT01_01085 [Vibrio tasmaniensis]PMP17774.1 hypothetical protein BCS92_05040 [Vibrio tasmaniensis]TKG28012.1 hypothetical protein FC057_22760 [Vibrio tasmaniensis]TKG41623.1 hypothetical protein FC063_07110 [Vibrio tasmaniensis]TKG44867.1 hypothetical protein FC061_20245 [Vibrio tasmaniensis]
MDIFKEMKDKSILVQSQNESDESTAEKKRNMRLASFKNDNCNVLNAAKKVLSEFQQDFDLLELLREMGVDTSKLSSRSLKDGTELTFNLNEKEFVCEYKEFVGREQILANTTIALENDRKGQLNKDNLGKLYNAVVLTGGNVQPGFANQPKGEDGKFEILDSQRRREVCILENLTYKTFVSTTPMTNIEARKLSNILQNTHKPLSFIQKADALYQRFVDNADKSLNETNTVEEIFSSSRYLVQARSYICMGEEPLAFLVEFLGKDIHSLSNSEFIDLIAALKPILDEIEKLDDVMALNKKLKSKKLEGTVEHTDSLNEIKTIQSHFIKKWEVIGKSIKSTVSEALNNAPTSGPVNNVKNIAKVLKLSVMDECQQANKVKSPSRPKAQNLKLDGDKREASILRSGSRSKPSLTIVLNEHSNDEMLDAEMLISSVLTDNKLKEIVKDYMRKQ